MRILITGDKGFVGQETTKLLQKNGHEVYGYDIMYGRDIRSYQQFYNICLSTHPNRVLHLAAISRFNRADNDPKLTYEINQQGTENVVRVCKELKIPLVYSSTASVYMPITQKPPIREDFIVMGNSQYACSKLIGEKYVQTHTPYIILRYAHLFGKEKRSGGLVDNFINRVQRGLAPVLYGGKQSNAFTYIKDVARANLLALTAPWNAWNEIYNISSDEEIKVKNAMNIIAKIFNYNGKFETKNERVVDSKRFLLDTKKAENLLGFKTKYTFEQGLKDMKKEIK